MKTDQHTVTLPIADYQELMALQTSANKKFAEMQTRLIERLRKVQVIHSPFLTPQDVISEIIKQIEQTT